MFYLLALLLAGVVVAQVQPSTSTPMTMTQPTNCGGCPSAQYFTSGYIVDANSWGSGVNFNWNATPHYNADGINLRQRADLHTARLCLLAGAEATFYLVQLFDRGNGTTFYYAAYTLWPSGTVFAHLQTLDPNTPAYVTVVGSSQATTPPSLFTISSIRASMITSTTYVTRPPASSTSSTITDTSSSSSSSSSSSTSSSTSTSTTSSDSSSSSTSTSTTPTSTSTSTTDTSSLSETGSIDPSGTESTVQSTQSGVSTLNPSAETSTDVLLDESDGAQLLASVLTVAISSSVIFAFLNLP